MGQLLYTWNILVNACESDVEGELEGKEASSLFPSFPLPTLCCIFTFIQLSYICVHVYYSS